MHFTFHFDTELFFLLFFLTFVYAQLSYYGAANVLF